MNGVFILILAFTIVGAFSLVPRAFEHDRLLEQPEEEDSDAFGTNQDRRYEQDADNWRKGES